MSSFRALLSLVATAAFCVLVSSSARAQPEVTLTLHHFLSPKSLTHTRFIEPWARTVETQSGGRIKIEIFPSMTMGGKPPELYRQLRDGAADIVWTLPGYTPGVFPRSEVFELPTVHNGSARATNVAIQKNFTQIAADYKDIHPILVHVHAGNALHLVRGCVSSVPDLAGLKLRTPTRTGGWMITSWGAEPVGMPVPALPQALAKGVVDGALIPFEIVPPLKVQDMTKCSVTPVNDGRFGTAVFLFAMNKDRYRALPADLRAIIDDNSGAKIAERVGAMWDGLEDIGKNAQKKTGSPIQALDQATSAELLKRGKQVEKRWVEEASKRGIKATELVDAARRSIRSLQKD